MFTAKDLTNVMKPIRVELTPRVLDQINNNLSRTSGLSRLAVQIVWIGARYPILRTLLPILPGHSSGLKLVKSWCFLIEVEK